MGIASVPYGARRLRGGVVNQRTRTRTRRYGRTSRVSPPPRLWISSVSGSIGGQSSPTVTDRFDLPYRLAARLSMHPDMYRSHRRYAWMVLPRQVVWYVLRTHYNWTLKTIGDSAGGRCHTTVLHGVRRVSDLIDVADPMVLDLLRRV